MKTLFELFDNPAPFTSRYRSGDLTYSFEVEGTSYNVFFTEGDLYFLKNVRKLVQKDFIIGEVPDFIFENSYNLVFSATNEEFFMSTEIIDSGNAFAVFSTVKVIIVDFLKKNPETAYVFFSAKEPSRIKLYRTFAHTVHRQTKALEFVGETAESGDVYFLFRSTDSRSVLSQ